MTAATKSSTTPRSQWPLSRTNSAANGLSKPRTPASVGHSNTPRLTPNFRPAPQKDGVRSPSPNYFGLVVESNDNPIDSNPGQHAKKNWKSPSLSIQSKVTPKSPKPVPSDQNPEYEEFRKQSEAYAFNLSQKTIAAFRQNSRSSATSPLAREPLRYVNGVASLPGQGNIVSSRTGAQDISLDRMEVDSERPGPGDTERNGPASFFDQPRNETPENISSASAQNHLFSPIDERHPRLSLPHPRAAALSSPPPPDANVRRSETLPSSLQAEGANLINPQDIANLLSGTNNNGVLLLDLRVSPQFSQSRLNGALNLCIPTTLLKRPSYNLQRLTDAFTDKNEKNRFSKWREASYIIVYDASSASLKDATACVNTLKKFTNEGYQGYAYIIKGGFEEASKALPHLVVRANASVEAETARKLSIQSTNNVMPVAGGCPMPATKSAANPFFGNIRQNMDLIGGVGQISVKLPVSLGTKGFQALPKWLRSASSEQDKGKAVSDKFLSLEKEEQSRMQKALSTDVSYGTPSPSKNSNNIQIAGIEKGSKNRYKDMLPYEHARVKLQNNDETACDYINASHIQSEWSNRRYIATQAPVQATFEDFWRVVWEQKVRVLVMLTAETEGGQRKCHPYWEPGSYGSMKLKSLSERRVSLQMPDSLASPLTRTQLSSPLAADLKASAFSSRRRATNPHGSAAIEAARDNSNSNVNAGLGADGSSEGARAHPPHVIVRTLALSHAAEPFVPIREITQVVYEQWPDFGTPAHPADLLALVDLTGGLARGYRRVEEGGTASSSARSPISPISPTSPVSPLDATLAGPGPKGLGRGTSKVPSAMLPAAPSEPPLLVHCSAGCGRTGTFCAIDTAVDMLKRQRLRAKGDASVVDEVDGKTVQTSKTISGDEADMAMEGIEVNGVPKATFVPWVNLEDVDLVEKAVQDFRRQRLSMVQTLRQYVLCYEAVLEWLIREVPERFRGDWVRRSFQG